MARSRQLVGRQITAVRWNKFYAGKARGYWSTNPVFILDNGDRVCFSVDETETGEYGISVQVVRPKKVD
jgi:hypothetical protein